jgi:hypothetical protein
MDLQYNSVTGLPNNPLDSIQNLDINPLFLFILVGILIIFYIFFSVVSNQNKNSNNESNNGGNNGTIFLEILLWSIFIILILLNGISYFFNLDIITSLKDIFSPEPKLKIKTKNYLGKNDTNGSTSPTHTNGSSSGSDNNDLLNLTEEVFNIPENIYNYDQAKAVCKAYDSKLATYKQIEDAYEKGANWCNYGWSADQLALFPTNYKTWQKLRKIKGHENDCGRAGINGGYIANPNVRFGVNCYGKKPKITGTEEILMNNSSLFPQTVEELEMERRVAKYKNKINNILISPFNHDNWNQH